MTAAQAPCPLQAGQTKTQMKVNSCESSPRGTVRIHPKSPGLESTCFQSLGQTFPTCLSNPLDGFQMCPPSSRRGWVPPTVGQRLRSLALTYTFFLLLNTGEALSPRTEGTCLITQLFQKGWVQNPGVHTACMHASSH